ncbi:MAG: DUF4234 domain-containing protein [Planctomycetota bacterium]
MPIQLRCSGCGATLRVGDEVAGKKVKCPKCGEVFRAPAAGDAGADPEPTRAPSPEGAPLREEPPSAPRPPTGGADHVVSIPLYIILTLVTCGIFNLYWNYRQMLACNDLVGRREFKWLTWFLLSLVTCGIYHIYYQYKMGSVIVEIQRKQGAKPQENLPVIGIILTIFGLSFVVDIIHQSHINRLAG